MPSPPLAHVINDVADQVGGRPWLVLAALAFVALLSLRHLSVKHCGLDRSAVIAWLTVVVAVGLVSVVALPAPTSAQDPQPSPGLPDLISDRPFIWFDKVVENPDGTLSRVLAFDGYLHNVGEGTLDLLGNPQIEGDVKQRVFDGESWEEVGSPTVRYETTDGHNHFHLIGAVDYSLWAETQSRKVGDSSKVGFCLVDTEQIEETHPQFYDLTTYFYCNEDNPEATELRMGITPGWRDTYDASITLQWVDVSDVQPGRYWVGAVTDPLNEIVESDEENNSLVYSMNTFPVSGFTAIPSEAYEIDGATEIDLPTTATATVGLPTWTITSAPRNGTLDVPIGAAINDATVTYRPDPGFTGTDSFTYHVRDSSRIFPLQPSQQDVELIVIGSDDDDAESNSAPTIDSDPQTINAPEFVRLEQSFAASDADGDDVHWFARNLPAGLRLDQQTGVVSGVPTTRGFYPSQIIAWDGLARTEIDVTWTIDEVPDEVNLWPRNHLDSTIGDRVWITLGQRVPGASYEAEGMPDGLDVVNNSPRVSGIPTTAGSYDVLVREMVDGVETNSVEFTWSIRPAAVAAFPL